MFSIYDGREKFYQWDQDRKIIVDDKTIKEVHFANCLCPTAKVCEVYELDGLLVVDVPNVLLTEYMDIRVWGYDGGMTKHNATFEVVRKPKPDDYIYTETECRTFDAIIAQTNTIIEQNAKIMNELIEIDYQTNNALYQVNSWLGIEEEYPFIEGVGE